MLSNIKKFQGDERGSIAIMFGLTAFVLFWCVGLAIDGARAYAVNSRIAAAIDAAALAGARGMRLNNLTTAETEALTQKYFKVNFEATGGDYSMIDPPLPPVYIDRTAGSVEIVAQAKVPTIFGTIGGIDYMTVSKGSIAVFTSKELEISMQLDMTGSMGEDAITGKFPVTTTSKMDELKSATADFIDIMLPDVATGQKVRIGLAPFSSGVNAGDYYKDVNGNRGTNKCTFERISLTNQATDDFPSGQDALKIPSEAQDQNGNNGTCPKAEVIAMTDDKVALKNSISSFEAGGSTAGQLGAAWAYYLLSPNWGSIWPATSKPAAFKDNNTRKIALLMTDGKYNTVGAKWNQDVASRKLAKDTCDAMKKDGITIYTIGFKLDDPDAQATMQYCASGSDKALLADNGPQLRGVFATIANQITSLRLTQ
jgi:Flp pilus assembly protein TadG